ncbi:MAG: DNA-binding protein [Oscillospiraceae bacterium]|jgi:predicted DNA-binding protein YlxM (UPF0122 family)|nr:DNA-binding protein [Oscillospiraceae bacterium]
MDKTPIDKRVDASLLLSFYGALLTDRQREMLALHYEDDLSLSEVATLAGVTRQGAHDAIRRGEAQLFALEEQLGLRARWARVCEGLRACRAAIESGNQDMALRKIDALLREEEERNGL